MPNELHSDLTETSFLVVYDDVKRYSIQVVCSVKTICGEHLSDVPKFLQAVQAVDGICTLRSLHFRHLTTRNCSLLSNW